ncbi:MAG: insulinase family protein [Phyllobacteriaceae bacterium]|nr:insulinase family protein [Phyllobacteriaceae bacterium]
MTSRRFPIPSRFGAVLALVAVFAVGLLGAVAPAAAGRIQKVVSPGGIEAWLVEEHAVPLIAVDFSFEGGSTQDPTGKEGTVNLLTTLLDEGAGDLDSQTYQTKLEESAIDLSFSEDLDRFSGEMKTLSENRDRAFDLLALALAKPRFDKEAVERMRTQTIAALRRASRNPETVASRLWAKTVFGDHPYGRPGEGTEATVQAIGIADLKAAHDHIFARKGLKIAVVGDIDAATLGPALDRIFGALPAESRLTAVAETTPKAGVSAHDAVDVPQAAIRFGLPGLKRADPDFIAAYLMNHILGGGTFSSWLYTEVREKRGLAYTIATGLVPQEHAGQFVGFVGTSAERVDETMGLVRRELARMRDVGPTEEELVAAKAYLIGSYPLRFDTSDKIAGALLGIQVENLGIDYVDKRNAMIEAVTLDDVKRVAGRLLAEAPSFVVVGPNVPQAPPTPEPSPKKK